MSRSVGGEGIYIHKVKAAQSLKLDLGYATGASQQRSNLHYEPGFRLWVMHILKQHGPLLYDEVMNGGAEVVGPNPQTIKTYLEPMLTRWGHLKAMQDALGRKVVMLRDPDTRSLCPFCRKSAVFEEFCFNCHEYVCHNCGVTTDDLGTGGHELLDHLVAGHENGSRGPTTDQSPRPFDGV